jgi:UDP-N-acetyl-D-mannosaminuronate dehydrogenase
VALHDCESDEVVLVLWIAEDDDDRDQHTLDLTSVPLSEASLRSLDAAVLVTDHSAFPYELVHRSVPLIVDTRNAFRSRGLQGAHVVSA